MPVSQPIRVLLVEDSSTDAKQLQYYLRKVRMEDFEVTWVERIDDAIAHLAQQEFDVGLLDLTLPDSTGIATYTRIQEAAPQLPIVVLTGAGDETTGIEAIRRGVQDYLVKGLVDGSSVARSIRYAIERKRAHDTIIHAKKEWEQTFDCVPDLIAVLGRDHRILRVNKAMARKLGKTPAECVGMCCHEIVHGTDTPPPYCPHVNLLKDGKGHVAEIHEDRWHGDFDVTVTPLTDASGAVYGAVHVAHDITERKRVENELRQSEGRFRLALANAPVSVAAQDLDLRYMWAFNQRTGNSNNIIGKTDTDLFAPDDAAHLTALKRKVIASGLEVREQMWVVNQGTRAYLSLHLEPLRDQSGRVTGVGVATVDLTPMRSAVDYFELLAETASELLQAPDPLAVVESLCTKVLEHLDCHVFFNFLVDKGAGKLHLNAYAGISADEASRIEWLDSGSTVCESDVRDGHRVVAQHIPSTPDPRTDLVKSYGVKAYACHPLVAEDGKALGTLSFGTRTREAFSPEDLSLMKAVADQVSVAVVRMNNMQDLARMNQVLTALTNSSQAMVRATDEIDYMQSVCNIIVGDCGHSMVWIGFAEDDAAKTIRPVAWSGFDEGYLASLNLTWSDTERGRGPTGTAIRTGEMCACRDMLVDPAFAPWRAEALARGYASSLALPLGDGARVFGALMVYSKQPYGFGRNEERLFAELAGDLGYGITALRIRASRARVAEEIKNERNLINTILQTTGGLIVGLDSRGCIKIFNQACEKVTGYTLEEARDRPFWDFLLLPEEVDVVRKTFLELTAGSISGEFENFWVARDGTRRFIHWTNSTILDAHGNVSLVIGTGMDITERKALEAELTDKRKRLEALVHEQSVEISDARETIGLETQQRRWAEAESAHRRQALEAVYAMTTASDSSLEAMTEHVASSIARILAAPFISIRYFTADAANAGTRFCKGEVSRYAFGSGPTSLFCTDIAHAAQPSTAHRESHEGQCEACFPGERIQSRVAVPVVGYDGEVCGTICALDQQDRAFEDYDIRLIEIFARYLAHVLSQRDLEAQLLRSNELKTLGQLTSGVAHEVRNPLNGIMAIMGALSKELSDAARFEPYLMHMRTQVTRLNTLMEDLLALGRPIAEERKSEVPVVAVVGNALSSWQQSLTEKREVKTRFDEKEALIRVDGTRIEQMLINLLENAHQHSPADTPIEVSVGLAGHEVVRIAVKDSGPGVPGELMSRIFEPFFTTRRGGTGLGLCIVKHIVESHDGWVGVHNNEGTPGATFYVSLPVAGGESR